MAFTAQPDTLFAEAEKGDVSSEWQVSVVQTKVSMVQTKAMLRRRTDQPVTCLPLFLLCPLAPVSATWHTGAHPELLNHQ